MLDGDRLILSGMQFWGKHGLFQEEQRYGQRFEVDVVVFCDMTGPCLTDQLSGALSYVTVYELVRKVMTEERHNLLQRLGQRICEALLEAHPARRVEVTIKKPAVAIGGVLGYAGVTIVREGAGCCPSPDD